MPNNFFIVVLLLLSLAGCAHHPIAPEIHDSATYQQKLLQLKQWQLEGKISVRHANQSDTAALRWQQDHEHFDVFISGPLGAGATQISGTPDRISIRNTHEESADIRNAQQVLEKHLGWTLPLEKLSQWMLGHSESKTTTFNTDHTLAGFKQDQWHINYLQYQVVDDWLLPTKIVLKTEDMQVSIFIKHWEIH